MVERVAPGVVQIITLDGAGTGFAIASDGRIVTNEHVVGGNRLVTVRIPGAGSYEGRVLGVDAIADLAIVDIDDGIPFTVLDMGDSDSVSIGEDVVAIGFPLDDVLGRNPTITRGVASSVRQFDGVDHIQTDAAINPGNSGGPLFNGAGEVIGVNTSNIRRENGRIIEGIGFAVAINEVKTRLPSLSSGESAGASPTPAPTPAPSADATPRSRGSSGTFILESGEMPHVDDGSFETITTFRNVRNFFITANFEVPRSENADGWSVGFTFRNSGWNDLSYIAVSEDGRYDHYERRDGKEYARLENGYVSVWNPNVGDRNKMTLVLVEDRGWLFVNSEYVTDMNVSGASERGALGVAANLFRGHGVVGESTRVRNVTASALEKIHGPSSGSLTSSATEIATRSADIDAEFAYAAVEFNTLDDSENWSAGLVFRARGEEDYLLFYVSSWAWWTVDRATYWEGDWQTLEEGFAGQIVLDPPILNRLELFYMGEVAIVYANGQRLGVVDIGGVDSVPESGDVEAAYGIYSYDDYGTAQYENFVVYGLPTN